MSSMPRCHITKRLLHPPRALSSRIVAGAAGAMASAHRTTRSGSRAGDIAGIIVNRATCGAGAVSSTQNPFAGGRPRPSSRGLHHFRPSFSPIRHHLQSRESVLFCIPQAPPICPACMHCMHRLSPSGRLASARQRARPHIAGATPRPRSPRTPSRRLSQTHCPSHRAPGLRQTVCGACSAALNEVARGGPLATVVAKSTCGHFGSRP